jgi:5-oxoprolinase (ATP-hydrolysing) subunit A
VPKPSPAAATNPTARCAPANPDALIHDPAEAAQQAVSIVQGKVVARDGSEVALRADTLCIHSDTPGSPQIAAHVAKALREADVQLGAHL